MMVTILKTSLSVAWENIYNCYVIITLNYITINNNKGLLHVENKPTNKES